MGARSILIVDDEESVLEAVGSILRKAKFRVTATPEAETALRLARQSPPDLIVLDINMPTLDGFDLAQMLSGHDDTKDVPILFLSGEQRMSNLVLAKITGAGGYVQKPFQAKLLLDNIRALLRETKRRSAPARSSPPRARQ